MSTFKRRPTSRSFIRSLIPSTVTHQHNESSHITQDSNTIESSSHTLARANLPRTGTTQTIHHTMAENYGGQHDATLPNLNQPFSGYSNGSIAFRSRMQYAAQDVKQFIHATYQSGAQSQNRPNAIAPATLTAGDSTTAMQPTATPAAGPQQAQLQHLQPSTTGPTAPVNLPFGWETEKFWRLRVELETDDGLSVKGTYLSIYMDYAETRGEIQKQYREWQRTEAIKIQQPSMQHPAKATQQSTGRVKATATTAKAKPRKKLRSRVIPNAAPTYAPDADLDTPQKCRDYLAYPDPATVHSLTFENDDWQGVLYNRKDEFIGAIFAALTHPYAQNPPPGITEEAQITKYHDQQQTQTDKVYALLETPYQIKAAKACCSLLFDAGVYVHETGIPKDVYEGYQRFVGKGLTIDRKYRVDMQAICSARLEKMVEGVKANKLIAVDVLEQKNFHRMARDPDFYLTEKFTYLRSNKTRQQNIDNANEQNKTEEQRGGAMGQNPFAKSSTKLKRKRDAEESEEEVGEGDALFNE